MHCLREDLRGTLGKNPYCAFPGKKTDVGLAQPDNLNKFRSEELSPLPATIACSASSSPCMTRTELWLSVEKLRMESIVGDAGLLTCWFTSVEGLPSDPMLSGEAVYPQEN